MGTWRIGPCSRHHLRFVLGGIRRADNYRMLGITEPSAPPLGQWPALNASALSAIGRFNNPNAKNTQKLIANTLGLDDVTAYWYWRNCNRQKARDFLNEILTKRHHLAHGVNSCPVVDNVYSA